MNNEIQTLPIADIQTVSKMMCKLFNKSESDLAALMLIANSEGKPIATAALEYDIIQGKPALNSRAAQSRFQLAGGKVCWIKSTETECEAEFTHALGGSLIIKWDMKRAELAGLAGKDTWKKYPAQMLRARCVAEGVRAVYPACLNQLYLVEEVQDFDNSKPTHERKTEVKSFEKEPVKVKEDVQEAKVVATTELPTDVQVYFADEMKALEAAGANVNGYLTNLGRISFDQTWSDLSDSQRIKIMSNIETFKQKATEFTNGKKAA